MWSVTIWYFYPTFRSWLTFGGCTSHHYWLLCGPDLHLKQPKLGSPFTFMAVTVTIWWEYYLVGGAVTDVFQCYTVVLLEYNTDLWFSNASTDVQLLLSKVSRTFSVLNISFIVIHKNDVMLEIALISKNVISAIVKEIPSRVNWHSRLQILLKVHCCWLVPQSDGIILSN